MPLSKSTFQIQKHNPLLRKIGLNVLGAVLTTGLLSATMVGFGPLLAAAEEMEVEEATTVLERMGNVGHTGLPPLVVPTAPLQAGGATTPNPLVRAPQAIVMEAQGGGGGGGGGGGASGTVLPEKIQEFHEKYRRGSGRSPLQDLREMRLGVIAWVRRTHGLDLQETEQFLLQNKHYLSPEGEEIPEDRLRSLIRGYQKKIERDTGRKRDNAGEYQKQKLLRKANPELDKLKTRQKALQDRLRKSSTGIYQNGPNKGKSIQEELDAVSSEIAEIKRKGLTKMGSAEEDLAKGLSKTGGGGDLSKTGGGGGDLSKTGGGEGADGDLSKTGEGV
jgi:hypothetical protein